MKEIELTRGKIALVDDADFVWLSHYDWFLAGRSGGKLSYAETHVTAIDGRQQTIQMHRVVAGCPPEFIVDHIDCDGLNNQRSNLRICTHAQNLANRRKHVGASQFKGVQRADGRWRARIGAGPNRVSLGAFDNEVDAAKAYDRAARDLYGEYARLNFPD